VGKTRAAYPNTKPVLKGSKFPKSLKYFVTLGLSFAILAYLGNAVFQTEKANVIHQHLLQARLLAHIGAVSIAYSLEEIRDAQQLILSFTEKKKRWRVPEIKPLISSLVKANNIVKWAGISTIGGRIIYQYPASLSLPPDFTPVPDKIKKKPAESFPVRFLLKSQMLTFSHVIKKNGVPRYFIWCIGSMEEFNRSFLNTYRRFNCKHLWFILQRKTGRKAFYMGPDFKQNISNTIFSLPFDYRELLFHEERLLVGAHPVQAGTMRGWFVVGIPRDQIEIQLAEFRYQGILLTGFFVVFISIFLFTYFKNRSRRIVAEQTANISREILISKQQLESYLENSSDGILRNDLNGKIRYVNPAFARMFGWEVKDVIGRNILDIFPEDRKRIIKVMETIREKKAFPPYDTKRKRKDGLIINLYVSASPILNSRGNVIAITAVYRDHTKMKRLEGRLHQSEKMAAIGQLVAQIAHEINNPLAVILQNIQVLNRRLSPELEANRNAAQDLGTTIEVIGEYLRLRGCEKMLNSVLHAGQRVAKIVENIQNFSRRGRSGFIPYSLTDLLEKTVELGASDYDMRHQFNFKAIQIVRDYQTVPNVNCDSSQIQQVILGLLKNAAQALYQNVDSPQITLRLFSAGEESVILQIEDNGMGMSAEVAERIFDPFYTRRDVGQGTGLGLSTAYFIVVHGHHGQLTVTSEPGRGSCFEMILPVENKEDS